MKPIDTVIVDDEPDSLESLRLSLHEYCPQVSVTAAANSVASGIEAINRHKPELVFLDISMSDGNGFDLLRAVEHRTFQVVFVTAHEDYAIRAFEEEALHYLLKPIDPVALGGAVARYELYRQKQIGKARQEARHKPFDQLMLSSSNEIRLVSLEDVLYCEADGPYTVFYLRNAEQIVVSKALNWYEKALENDFFFRVHHKHLINLRAVQRYVRGKGGYVILKDGSYINVSTRRKEHFLIRLKQISR